MATLNAVKEIDPRVMRLLRKRALRKTLPMVVIFMVIMLIIHDLGVTLFWGFFFSGFWCIGYRGILYSLLIKKYPDKFPASNCGNSNNVFDSIQKSNLDMTTNPIYKNMAINIHHHNWWRN